MKGASSLTDYLLTHCPMYTLLGGRDVTMMMMANMDSLNVVVPHRSETATLESSQRAW